MRSNMPWWQVIVGVKGAEGESEGGGNAGEGDDSGDDNSGDEEKGGDDDGSDSDDDSKGDDEGAGGKKALLADLAKERRARQRLQKQIDRLTKAEGDRKGEQDKADSDETEKVKSELAKANERAQKLAQGYRTQRVESIVKDAARGMKFLDPEDAVTYLSRGNYAGIDIDQDEDDPSDVAVDENQLEAALKKLAKTKPHLVDDGRGDGGPTGSKFSGRKKGDRLDQEALKTIYPALGSRR